MIRNFRDFIDSIIVESLHPELQDIITKSPRNDFNGVEKQEHLANKIKDLHSRGEKTGICS